MPEGSFDTPVPDPPPTLWPPALAGLTLNRFESSAHYNVAFGGVKSGGVLSSETWRITRANNDDGPDYVYSADNSLTQNNTPPGPRQLHAAVVIDGTSADANKLVVWGGMNASGQPINDGKIWVYRKTAQGYSWNSFTPSTGDDGAPPLRFGHGMIADPKGSPAKVFLFGGATAASGTLASDDVWVLEFTTPERDAGTWKKVPRVTGTSAGPGARAEFGMTSFLAPHKIDFTDKNAPTYPGGVVYGGRVAGGTSNSLWLLYTRVVSSQDQVQWVEVPYPSPSTNPIPLARTRCTIAWTDATHDLFVLGGIDANGHATDEVRSVMAIGHDVLDAGDVGIWRAMPGLPLPMHSAAAAFWDEANFSRAAEMFTPSASGGRWRDIQSQKLLQPWYPFNFLARPAGGSGGDSTRVFLAGPLKKSYFLQPHGTSPTLDYAGTQTLAGGSAVMYEPGRIMKSGSRDAPFYTESTVDRMASKQTYTIDLNVAQPAWAASANMNFPRVNENLVLLPDGKVLCTGGTQKFNNSQADTPVQAPEIWTPPAGTGAGTWGEPLATFPEVRDYHNSAILLNSGRVLTGGGNFCTGKQLGECDSNDVKMRIFTPPQYFEGTNGDQLKPRARIIACDGLLVPGGTVRVMTDIDFDHITLVRGGSVTHGQDQSQLFVRPVLSTTTSSKDKTFTLPADGWDLPPGFYQMFAMTADGMPSFSRWVHVRVKGTLNVGFSDLGDRSQPKKLTLQRTHPVGPFCEGDYLELKWIAPAEDSSIYGQATSYDLRQDPYMTSTAAGWAIFKNAEQITGEPAPEAVGVEQSMTVSYGMLLGNTYKFAMVTYDDRPSRSSAMSNIVSFQVVGCDDGLTGGEPPGGGFSSERTTGMNRLGQDGGGQEGDYENSLLPGVVPGLMRTDLMPLQNVPASVGGGYRLRLRRGHHGGSTLSDVRLVALDSAEEGCWVAEDGSFLAGAHAAATAVSSSAAGDVLAALGDDAHPHTAGVGDTLVVTLPTAAGSDGMWLRTMGSPALGIGGDYGLLVQSLGPERQWTTMQHVRPRRRYSDAVVRGLAGAQVRLIVLGQTAISGLGRVVSAAAPSIHEATAVSAEHSRIGALTASEIPGVVLAADESMSVLTSSLPEPAEGTTRRWYMRVTGEHDAETGSSTRASQGQDEDGAMLRFAIQSIRPNPSHGRITLEFTMPRAGAVKLEAFDLIGRRVASSVHEVARPGRHELAWEAKSRDGRSLSPGTYVVRLSHAGARVERKVLVMP